VVRDEAPQAHWAAGKVNTRSASGTRPRTIALAIGLAAVTVALMLALGTLLPELANPLLLVAATILVVNAVVAARRR